MSQTYPKKIEKIPRKPVKFSELRPLTNYRLYAACTLLALGVGTNYYLTGSPHHQLIGFTLERFEHIIGICSLLWAGVLIGVSFIEAPVKFTAQALEREVAFDVGRTVFHAVNKAEIFFSHIGAISIILQGPKVDFFPEGIFAVAHFLLFIQVLFLQPSLDRRGRRILANDAPPKSSAHMVYVLFEVVKLISLVWVGASLMIM